MPEIITLSAELRARAGKGAARATRRAGRVPGIVYGGGQEPMPISLEPRELSRALAKRGFFATLVDLSVDGAVQRTLPREVQYHPATDEPLHVDFMRVGADHPGHGHRAGRLRQPGAVGRDAPRRHPQHRPPRDRAELPGRRHPRSSDRQPRRARHRRQRPYQRGRAARRLPPDDHRRATSRSPASRPPRPCARRRPPPPPRRPPPSRPLRHPESAASSFRAASVPRAMRLVVGLGNPGSRYARNRHNVGFMAVDAIARRHGFPAFRNRFKGELAEGTIGGERRLLLKPQTFMNASGEAVLAAHELLQDRARGHRRDP